MTEQGFTNEESNNFIEVFVFLNQGYDSVLDHLRVTVYLFHYLRGENNKM